MATITTVGSALSRPEPAERPNGARVFRPRHSWLVYALGACVAAVVLAAVVEIISALLGAVPLRALVYQGAGYPSEVQWSEPSVRLASLVLAVVGAVLISLALLPVRGRWLVLWTDDPQFVGGLTRDGVRRELAVAACGVAGVRSADVAIERRGATVRFRTASRADDPHLADAVRVEVQRRLEELAPAYCLRVRSRVR